MVPVEELRTEPRAAQSVATESPQLLGEESLSELFPCPPRLSQPKQKKKSVIRTQGCTVQIQVPLLSASCNHK